MTTSEVTNILYPHAWKPGRFPDGMGARTRAPLFDALTATAHELQDLLCAGKLKSTDLVEEYVWRIEEYNSYLNAVFEYAPGVLQRALEMDRARANGQILGPLHGIPIIIKVNIHLNFKYDIPLNFTEQLRYRFKFGNGNDLRSCFIVGIET
jgi:hypothetical protein